MLNVKGLFKKNGPPASTCGVKEAEIGFYGGDMLNNESSPSIRLKDQPNTVPDKTVMDVYITHNNNPLPWVYCVIFTSDSSISGSNSYKI